MKNISITQKLIIFLILISLLPFAAISYINYSVETDFLEKKVFDDLTALAEAKSTHISTVLNFRISQIKEIATSNFMQEIEFKKDGNLPLNLNRVKNEIPEFFEISALDINGKVAASTESTLVEKNFEEEDFFKKAKEELYIGNIEYYNNMAGYVISSPVINRSTGEFIGVLLVRVNPRFTYDVTSDYKGLGKSGESLLVQRIENEVVFLNPLRYDPEAALRLRFPLDSDLAKPAILAAKGETGTIRTPDYRGIDVFAAYTFIPKGGWGLVVKIDSSEALMPAASFKERALALSIFYFITVTVLAYLLGRRLTGPLIKLSNVSKKVAMGDLTVEIRPESRDEIGELAQSFNVMVKRLKELYEGLEQKVKERTKDLNRRNLELAALIKTNQSISAGLDLENVLEIAVREAVRIVNVSYCSIVLVEPDKEYGIVTSEYSPRVDLKPSLGEILYLEDCPMLNGVYRERQYSMITDIRKSELSPKEREIAERLGMRSILVVPLILGDKTMGTMQLSSLGNIKKFNEEEISVCQTIANQVAIAIENAHLYSELKQHGKTLEILFEIYRVVSQSLNLDELLREAVLKTIKVMSTDAGWIYLLDKDKETLNLETSVGISPELIEAALKLKVGQGVSGKAVESGEPIVMDIENYPYAEILPLMVRDTITSLVGVPLVAKGMIVGAMVLSTSKHRKYSDEDINVLSSIGNQIGVAVENASLYSELKRHDGTLESLFEIDRVVSQSLDLDEIFRESLAKTIQVTAADSGTIYLLDENEKTLNLKTSSGISEEFSRAVRKIKLGEGVAGTAAEIKNPVVMDINHYPSRDLLPALEKEGIVTIVGTPLIAKGNVVGVMNLANNKLRIFSKEDLDLLASIGSQIGVAIENARLYNEVRISFERLQKAYEDLKSLDKMKSDFLSNVSHELKTPLVSIRGYSELMYEGKLGKVSETQNKAFEAIIRNTDRLTRLIDSLLFLSIQQMGKDEIKIEPVVLSVEEILTSALADMKLQAERKSIDLIMEVPPELVVMGDRDKLTEVFLNLIDNAVKFTSSGGKISVSAIEEEEHIHVTVSDTGIGIPENVIPLLFQRFYQADASLTRKYGGTGLGLYISKSIIEAHKGEIWIESKEGEGTTAHVRLLKKK